MGVIQQEAQAWVVRLESGQVTERDAQVFRHWCARSRAHANAFAEARAVWGAMAPAARAVKRAAQKPPASHARRALLGGAVAASLGLLVLRPPTDLWPVVTGLGADYATGTGEQRALAQTGGGTHVALMLLAGEDHRHDQGRSPGRVSRPQGERHVPQADRFA